MDNVGLAAHRSGAACPTCSPTSAPFPGAPSSRRGRPELSYLDNGSAYISTAHALACRSLGIRHIRTRPRRPQTNGKAERFIRTMLREWAYAAVYGSSPERAAALSGWLERYNYRRRHGALGHRPPIERLRELQGNNVAGIYS